MKNKKSLGISIILLILAFVQLISGFGVSSPYWEGNPMVLSPGEEYEINLNLQNMIGDDDLLIKAEMIKGGDIAKIKEGIYEIKAHTSDTMAPLTIKIPRDILVPQTKRIHIEFKSVTPHETGMVTMGTGMSVKFDVLIQGSPIKREIPWATIIISIGIIIIAIVIIILIRRRKRLFVAQQELMEKT